MKATIKPRSKVSMNPIMKKGCAHKDKLRPQRSAVKQALRKELNS